MKPYYERDGIQIWHGDCREILPTIAFDVIVADVPYGMGYKHGTRGGGIAYGMDGHSIAGDDAPFDPSHLIGTAKRTILWGGNHYADRLPASPGWLVWDKRDGTPSNDQSDAEIAWTDFLTVARVFSARWSGAHRTGREQREGRVHVNQKPVALMAWCLGLIGDGVVLDPYCGSGSTLVACKDLGRRAIGIEIEERYCEVAARRLAQGVLPFATLPT